VNYCTEGDKGLDSDTFCVAAKRKSINTFNNMKKNFAKAVNNWQNKNGENMAVCAATLGIETDPTQWSHDKLTKYKRTYKKKVPRTAWLGVKAFPKTPKKKKATPPPSCANVLKDTKGKKLSVLKAKKFVKVATKQLAKALEKSPNFCA